MALILPAIAGAVTLVLVLFAGGYGYHRDELYFIAAGKHLDWAYADQGPVTPLLARLMTEIAPDSLTVLRLPSALAAGLIVLLTGLMARDLGGSRRAQWLAAVTSGLAVIVLFNGHLLSTSTFDLLVWTVATWLVVKAVRGGNDKLWLLVGLVLGVGLLNKPLPAFLAVGVLAGVVIAGPRRLLRSPYVWGGALIAVVLFLPFVLWQAQHGWPQLEVSASIAGGGSTSSEPWWAMIPFQFLLVSPLLAPIWITGLVQVFRSPDLRFLGWTWALLAVAFMATGGKPYYLAGLLPVLIAAGAPAVMSWIDGGRARLRRLALGAALVSSAVIDPIIALPILPADSADVVIAMNEDVGETIGWPELAATVAQVHQPGAVILTSNYGEAGAVDRFGPEHDLPRAYSGHNAYHDWGAPPDGARPVVIVGVSAQDAERQFDGCEVRARLSNDAGVENGVYGEPVLLCDGPRKPWSQLWPELRALG